MPDGHHFVGNVASRVWRSYLRVELLCFGVLKDLFGGERDSVELAEGASVGTLIEVLRGRGVGDGKVWGSLAVAVNREYAGLGAMLKDGDEVALLPPVSGGSPRPHISGARCGAPKVVPGSF